MNVSKVHNQKKLKKLQMLINLENKSQLLLKGLEFINRKRNDNLKNVVYENKSIIIQFGILIFDNIKEQSLKSKLKDLNSIEIESEPSYHSFSFEFSYYNFINFDDKLERLFCELDLLNNKNEKIYKNMLVNSNINYCDIPPSVVNKEPSSVKTFCVKYENQCQGTSTSKLEETQTQTSVKKLITTNTLPSIQKNISLKISNASQTSKSLMKMEKANLNIEQFQLNIYSVKERNLNIQTPHFGHQTINPCLKVNSESQYELSDKASHLKIENIDLLMENSFKPKEIVEEKNCEAIDLDKHNLFKEVHTEMKEEEPIKNDFVIKKKKKTKKQKMQPENDNVKILSSEILNETQDSNQFEVGNLKEKEIILSKSVIFNEVPKEDEEIKENISNPRKLVKASKQATIGKNIIEDDPRRKKVSNKDRKKAEYFTNFDNSSNIEDQERENKIDRQKKENSAISFSPIHLSDEEPEYKPTKNKYKGKPTKKKIQKKRK